MSADRPIGDADRDREALLELLLADEGLTVEAAPTIARRDPDSAPVLSYAQERLWFLQEFETDTTALSIRAAMRLSGTVDVEALAASLDDLVARHASLRTTIRSVRGDAGPVVAERARMPFIFDDLRDAPDRDEQLEAIVAEEARRTFDLATEQPVLVRLVRMADDDHLLSVVMHHVASDGWSFQVFFRDLNELYAARLAGRPPVLPELPIEYGDYAAWQRTWVSGEKLETQLAYWREQLAGELPRTEIPTDFVRPAKHTFEGGQIPHALPAETVRALRDIAAGSGATLYMVMLAAFDVVLARHADVDDVIVGTPIAGRTRPELEGMIGMFVNSLVLRTDLSGDPTFRELVARVRDVSLGAFDHQDVSFEQLLAELHPVRDLSRTPLFQVFFNMMNFDAGAQFDAVLDLDYEVVEQPDLGSKFDLTLYVTEHERRTELRLVYNSMLYRAETMQHFLDQYVQLLQQVAADPDRPVSAYSLVTAAATAVLPDPTTPLDATWHGSVPEAVRRHAALTPDKVAVEDSSGRWSYRALSNGMDRVAAWLCAQSVGRGHIVAIHAHRSSSLVFAVVGVLASGAAYVLLDPSYPPGRLCAYLRIARPSAWLSVAGAGAPAPEVMAELDRLGVTARYEIAAPPDAGPGPWPDVGAAVAERLTAVTEAIGPDSPACLTFTSGSTGEPKAVLGRHGSLTHFLPWQNERFGVGADDRFTMLSGLAHDPIQRDMFWALSCGATIVVPDPDQIGAPRWLADWMRRERVTVAHLTPAMGQLALEGLGGATAPVESLRLALFIGDILTRSTVARFHTLAPNATVVNLYGTTETQRASGYHVVDLTLDETDERCRRERDVLPLGVGIPNTQLLVRSDAGLPAGIGEVGEIWFRSPHLALGYLDRPAETAARFVEASAFPGDRLYRTGDRGRYGPSGEVEFLGRADGQVQLRGYRIELGEVRSAIVEHEAVSDAVVLVHGCNGSRALVAYVVAEPGAEPDPQELRQRVRRQLPTHMVPADVVFISRVPLTPNGKLDRAALPAPSAPAAPPDAPPRDDLERRLVGWWQEVLGREVGIHDNFFELGGYSLLATRLFAMIEAGTGRSIPLTALFEAPTIAELAEVIRGGKVTTDLPSLVPIQPLGTQPPFFYVAPYMISALQFVHLGAELGEDQPLYGLQPQGLDGSRPTHTSIEQMAEAYIRQIRTVQPHGPYRIGGHCSGAWVAFEMARQLEQQGEELDSVVLVDQGPPAADRPAIRLPSYLVGRIRFYFRDDRLRHAIAWQAKIMINRLRLKRMWNPTSEVVEKVRATHRTAFKQYGAKTVRSDLVLIRSDESIELQDKFWYLQWQERTTGRFEETRSVGTHANLLERPYVVTFAERLRWAFGRSRAARR